jgi:hypothetical protein
VVDTACSCCARRCSGYLQEVSLQVQLLNVDGQNISALARSLEALSEIVDVVRRLLVAYVREVVELEYLSVVRSGDVFSNAPSSSFAYLVEQCQNLKALTLKRIALDEDHCRVLGNFSEPGLEIELDCCEITVAACGVLAQVLGRNHGPTKLGCCDIDNSVLADGLRGNSRLKSLSPRLFGYNDGGNQEVLAITGGLRENKGLIDVDLQHDFRMSDGTWDALCDSLKTHPTLQALNLLGSGMIRQTVLKARVQALVDMMKVNISIHTIHLHACYSQHKLFRESVIPDLETNRFRPRLLAI